MNRALVVDDEEAICECLKEELEELGFEVAVRMTGEEAIALIDKEPLKIAVVDMRLATEVTGMDIIKALRAKQPETIVLAMTGYVDIGLKQKTESLGVSGFLEKPNDIQPDVFRARVQQLMERSGA